MFSGAIWMGAAAFCIFLGFIAGFRYSMDHLFVCRSRTALRAGFDA
jgi:hypothetical protein